MSLSLAVSVHCHVVLGGFVSIFPGGVRLRAVYLLLGVGILSRKGYPV